MRRNPDSLLIALAFVAFVSLGLPDGVLGVAWPSIRAAFGRPVSHLGLLLAGGMAGYLVSSFLAGQMVRALGVGKLLAGSGLLVTAALAGSALTPAWGGMLLAAVVGGLGAGAIDAGLNTFAAARFSPRVVNWLHAFWGVGATASPLLMTALLTSGHGWRLGYGLLAAALAALSLLFLLTLRLWRIGSNTATDAAPATATLAEALRRPAVWMQLLLFFVYCGIESTAGQLLYTLFTESRGIAVPVAGAAVGGYWASLTLGRLFFGQLAASLGRKAVLRTGLTLAPIAAACVWWNPADWVGLGGAALLGFALAPVFPTLISATPDRVGPYYAPQSVGFQVAAAAVGIATFPGLVGLLARRAGLEAVAAYLLAASLLLLALHEVALRLPDPALLLKSQEASAELSVSSVKGASK